MDTATSTDLPDSPRRQKHRADSDDDDRISKLPDSILGHILSNLSTKYAMSTAVLSKRWKFAWTTTGNLDFISGKSEEQFVKYVNRVMLLHKPAGYFNKLFLLLGSGCNPFYVNTWICSAISRNVHELILDVSLSNIPIHIQSYLFSSEKLKSLELSCNICISPDIVVSLPSLERLDLCQVYFPSEEVFTKIIAGCPVLNRLSARIDINKMLSSGYIKRVNGVAAFICRISSTSLKHVELFARDVVFNAVCGVELDAPSLEYIQLYQISSIVVVQPRLEFLCEADSKPPDFELETRFPNYCNSFVQALEAFSCAKTLYLPEDVIRALSCATIKMQAAFNRLTKLTVHIGQDHWSSVQNLIELSDNLEVLIVDKDADYCYDEEHYHNLAFYDDEGQYIDTNWTNPDAVPKCLSKSLKKVLICAYDGNADEQAMVEYIIKNGSVLDTMHIRFGATFSGYVSKYQLVQLLSTSKKSTTCEVKFADFIDFFDERDAEYYPGNGPNRRSMHYFYL